MKHLLKQFDQKLQKITDTVYIYPLNASLHRGNEALNDGAMFQVKQVGPFEKNPVEIKALLLMNPLSR